MWSSHFNSVCASGQVPLAKVRYATRFPPKPPVFLGGPDQPPGLLNCFGLPLSSKVSVSASLVLIAYQTKFSGWPITRIMLFWQVPVQSLVYAPSQGPLKKDQKARHVPPHVEVEKTLSLSTVPLQAAWKFSQSVIASSYPRSLRWSMVERGYRIMIKDLQSHITKVNENTPKYGAWEMLK